MSGELNFEALPFEAYDGFRTPTSEQSGFELEEEFGRGAPSRSGGSPRRGLTARAPRVSPQGPGIPSALGGRKTPPIVPQPFPFHPPRRPRGLIGEPLGVAAEPYPVEPAPYPVEPTPAGSEYMRWVQSALNDVLGSQLPVHGIADSATRNAIRSFQQREELPIDGIVGPDTERALLAARSGRSAQEGAPGRGAPMARP